MISSPAIGPLTQGTLFSCALAEEYDGCRLHGLVITARCDVEHDKTSVINYVPVVSFDDWMACDGLKLVSERVAKARLSELRQIFTQLGLASSILDVQRPAVILDKLFGSDAEPKFIKQRAKTEETFSRLHVARTVGGAEKAAGRSFLATESSETRRVIKELCRHALPEAYYLPGVSDEHQDGAVALLREVRHLPIDLVRAIEKGMDEQAYQALCAQRPQHVDRLSFSAQDFSWPTGILQSPHIEHLMQRLTLLFSRIGVTDVPLETMDTLFKRAIENVGEDS